MKTKKIIYTKHLLKINKVFLLLCLLISSISLQAQSPSCSACMGGFHGEPDEYVDVLIQYNKGEEPVKEKAARYGETVVYGGDVVMTNDYSSQIALRGTVVSDFSRLWPNSTIPYIWGGGLSQSMRNIILAAIDEINAQSNLCVVERTNEAAYVIFESNAGAGDCYVLGIGNLGTPNQTVNLGSGCESKGTIIHELLHKAGFFHEQTHPDRDNFITVNWNNLDGQIWTNQFIQQSDAQAAGTYDFASIMHYPQYHPQVTINDDEPLFFINSGVTVPTGVSIGNMPGMSSADIAAVNSLYSCGTGGGGGGPTCYDGIQNQGETGVDCNGPCAPCATNTCSYTINNNTSCTYDIFWWDGANFTYAGRTNPYSSISVTATNGMQFGVYNAFDYGYSTGFTTVSCATPYHYITQNVCGSTATCTDGIQNQGETGIDCGGPCAACPTCYDGIQNQGETGVDCGYPCAACTSNCSYTISNNTGCAYDIFWWDGANFTYAGRTNAYSSLTVNAVNGMQFGVYDVNDYANSTGFTTVNCYSPYHTITQSVCSTVANTCSYNIRNYTGCTYDYFWWDGTTFTYAGRTNPYSYITVTAIDGMQFGIYDAFNYNNSLGFVNASCSISSYAVTQSVCANASPTTESDDVTVTRFTVYPNPVHTQSTIEYSLWKESQVTIYISDLTGKKVAVLSNHEQKSTGVHQVDFDAGNFASGMYYCTIVAGDYVNTQKVILTK